MPPLLKTHPARTELLGKSSVRAVVSVFGNVDVQGDRVREGAFTQSLQKWRSSGDKIPYLWSHAWSDPFAHLGVVEDASETKQGLEVVAKIDNDTPFSRQVLKLLRERRVVEHSFSYDIPPGGEHRGKDGVNELTTLDIIECGPCLRGANSATTLLDVKSVHQLLKTEERIRNRIPDPRRCRKGHILPEPRVLMPGMHPAAICHKDGSVNVWAPPEASDAKVRVEIFEIARHLADYDGEIARLRSKLKELEIRRADHQRAAPVDGRRELARLSAVLDELEVR